jgi:transketolase
MVGLFAQKPHPLNDLSRDLRLQILESIYKTGSGHLGGSFSSIDIMIALYYSRLFDFNKDHFILSAGHLCLSHYAVLASCGKFSSQKLNDYGSLNSKLEGHESIDVPGVEYSSGCLGQGLSFASGLALGDDRHHTICLTSDGEHNEGQIWESIMFANKYHQGNLINIVDCNGVQIDGRTDDIMPTATLAAKYLRFGWTVTTVDGHNFDALINAIKKAKNSTIYPACIIAKTISARGIPSMENDYHFHDVKDLSSKDYEMAKTSLERYLI